jgi:4-hydroxybenzoate polyprenyltransferase
MAQGLLSFREGLVWAVAWSGVAMAGAYLLNPVCVLIFLAGCGLEAFYCVMLKISPLRTLVSGAVKTSGPVAAVFAVDPSPSPTFVLTLFLCLFFWEIGGQNVPADWTDMEEDRQFRSRTIPVRFGPGGSSVIILGALLLAVIMSVLIFEFTATGFHLLYRAAFFAVGTYLLLIPAYRLHRQKQRANAMVLFNRASYYPPALLLVVMVKGLL